MLTWEGLNSYVNFGIQDICYTGRTNPNENHCAHFVCHALGISHGGGRFGLLRLCIWQPGWCVD
jgi:hypothetical protein